MRNNLSIERGEVSEKEAVSHSRTEVCSRSSPCYVVEPTMRLRLLLLLLLLLRLIITDICYIIETAELNGEKSNENAEKIFQKWWWPSVECRRQKPAVAVTATTTAAAAAAAAKSKKKQKKRSTAKTAAPASSPCAAAATATAAAKKEEKTNGTFEMEKSILPDRPHTWTDG